MEGRKWDDLGAAHGAASLFDLLCIAGMFTLGWRIAGLRLGIGLALAWAAFPFTAYALETNANDSLVAAALIWGLVLLRHPVLARAMLGLSLAAKFAPAVLLLLWSRKPFPGLARAATCCPTSRGSPAPESSPAGCCCSTAPTGSARSGTARSATSWGASRRSRSGDSTPGCGRCRSA